jgi:recombination protein RecR
MRATPKPVADLISEFEKLPGVGPKSAQRLVYHLLHAPKDISASLAKAVSELKDKTRVCTICGNIGETDPCLICSDTSRNKNEIMVVEEPLDILAVEKTRVYDGLYHVLHGAISPLQNIGPEDLTIKELLDRLRGSEVKEIILATNPNMEGEATAMYLQKLIAPLDIKITRIARGLPVGADLEYADEITLTRAVEGRTTYAN